MLSLHLLYYEHWGFCLKKQSMEPESSHNVLKLLVGPSIPLILCLACLSLAGGKLLLTQSVLIIYIAPSMSMILHRVQKGTLSCFWSLGHFFFIFTLLSKERQGHKKELCSLLHSWKKKIATLESVLLAGNFYKSSKVLQQCLGGLQQ